MKPDAIETFFARLAKATPEPQTELNYVNDYTLLVAVVLSAQATDAGVNRATKALFQKVKTPQAMVKLGLEGLKAHIRTIGLFNTKAVNVIALSQALIDKHKGQVPRDRQSLEALPGVGRKTANVVLNVAFGEETCAVDTHIFRVSNRTGLAPGKNVRAVEDKLMKKIPPAYRRHAHHWLILHGRYICTARSPKCHDCPMLDICPWPQKSKSKTAKPAAKKTLVKSKAKSAAKNAKPVHA